MSRSTRLSWFLMVFALFGLASCSGGTPTTDPSLAYTQIWKTVEVAQTQTALAASPTASITYAPVLSPSLEATNTPPTPNTPQPGAPTETPSTILTPVPTRSSACDNANFVADVTIPDGTEVLAASTFVKTWRFKNLGPCTWTTSYRLVYSYVSDSGKNGVFTPPAPVSFPNSVLPGEEVDISITLTAPTKPEAYRVVFVLQNNKGYSIPLANMNSYEFWVEFVVK